MKSYVGVLWWIVLGIIALGLGLLLKECHESDLKHRMKKKEAYEKCIKEDTVPRCDCQTLYLEILERDDSCR